ncbi:MAG: hypothetical protein JSV92_01385 [archaeon]|nr:MAG: hypothetical protein JSV92_01385 [archaeon]
MKFLGFLKKEKKSGHQEKIKQVNETIAVLLIILVFMTSLVLYTMGPSFGKMIENRKIEDARAIDQSLKWEEDNYTECDCVYQCSVVYNMETDVENVALLGTGECLCMNPDKDFYRIKPDGKCPEYELFTRNVVEREIDQLRQDRLANSTE